MIIFEAIENIEVAIKTQLSNIMSLKHGIHWYVDEKHFFSESEKKKIREKEGSDFKFFDHAAFLAEIEEELENPQEVSLQHYKRTYEPKHPPSWMVMEMISIGTLSKMVANLRPSDEKNAICEAFSLTKLQLVSWLHCFTYLRNRCAHHARLVYLTVRFAPAMPQKTSRIFLKNEYHLVDNCKLYAALSCMQFMLQTCNGASTFKQSLKSLCAAYPEVDYHNLGFTPNWQNELHWL